MSTLINTCIIPAAGKGSRWAPVSGYLPKEMLPLIDRPVIEWVINEVANSGCKNIIIVLNNHKEVIRKYLTTNKKLSKINFQFIYQDEPLGLAHAILMCKKLIQNNPFAVALPDLPTISKKPVMKQMFEAYNKTNYHTISFAKFSNEYLHFYTECLVEQRKDKLLEIVHFCPKFKIGSHHPGNFLRMQGRYVLNPEIMPVIESLLKEKDNQEITDKMALEIAMQQGQKIVGMQIHGHSYDTGTPEGYVRANTAFFKKLIYKN